MYDTCREVEGHTERFNFNLTSHYISGQFHRDIYCYVGTMFFVVFVVLFFCMYSFFSDLLSPPGWNTSVTNP